MSRLLVTLAAVATLAAGAIETAAVSETTISGHPHGWSSEISIAAGGFTLEVDGTAFSFQGDPADPGRILIDIAGREKPLVYRLWPDIATWQLSEVGKARYAKEFEGIPGWEERTIRVSVDFVRDERRVWVDERLVKSWQSPSKHPRLHVAGREEKVSVPVHRSGKAPLLGGAGGGSRLPYAPKPTPNPSKEGNTKALDDGPFLELPLAPYFNDEAATPYAPDASIDLGHGMALRYESNTTTPHNLDLGKLTYRVAHMDTGPYQHLSLPYVNCDAMSSDPKRAIFRVPARFYDQLHLLCYDDGDEGEVPRAAVRFMKADRVRFLTREFGLVPEKGVRILESREVGNRSYTHVAIDLNPGAFQEFLDEAKNLYFEFELTRPVVMDNNSFEHPAGPPSSLHVVSMVLEEAPVTMIVDSAVPGHLFEQRDDAVMRVHLKSNRNRALSGFVHVESEGPDGRPTKKTFEFSLSPREAKSVNIDVGDALVGKSDFTARLVVRDAGGAERVLKRNTSFAMLPAFKRTAKDSPFGMWSFFEGHFGADFETTCEVLRKAGVRGTLANFVLGTEPATWAENAIRTETLRKHGIEANWGLLAGIADAGLRGMGDMDGYFDWIKAHPQVKNYNLFWETRASQQTTTLCPPEIRGRAPRTWSGEERKRIDTFMAFGKAWAARARKDAPEIKLSFGNGFPEFISAMLGEGFPLDYIDMLGLDFDMYTSAPEDQPSMWYAPFAGIYYLRELRKVYGCEDKPLVLTEAIYCPTSPIWLTEREQADYYVRAHLLALAMGVEAFGMCAEPIDPDGAYHYGHYGPVGLCHATPEMNPREAYGAYAAMTGVLDGANFETVLDLGSPHAYGLRFRKNDGACVYALWTVNGTRGLTMKIDASADLAVYNRDGRDITDEHMSPLPDTQSVRISLELDESPQYVVGSENMEVSGLEGTSPIPGPEGTRSLVQFDSLDDWAASDEPLAGYEDINPATPVAWAKLDLAIAKDVLQVRPPKVRDTHPLETLCMNLRHVGKSLEIPQEAEAIGVYAKGDRSWGRVVFVLEDQAGDRWISAHSQTPVNVDGEIYLETKLPKAPTAEHPGYRNYRPWKRDKDDVIPEYPLRLTGLLLELRTHAIHGPDLVPLSDEGFELRSIVLR